MWSVGTEGVCRERSTDMRGHFALCYTCCPLVPRVYLHQSLTRRTALLCHVESIDAAAELGVMRCDAGTRSAAAGRRRSHMSHDTVSPTYVRTSLTTQSLAAYNHPYRAGQPSHSQTHWYASTSVDTPLPSASRSLALHRLLSPPSSQHSPPCRSPWTRSTCAITSRR